MPDEAPPQGFEWDPAKAASNRARHRVTFDQAAEAVGHPRAVSGPDTKHSGTEPRGLTVAPGRDGRLLVIALARRAGRIRIISARRANDRAKRRCEQATGHTDRRP